MSQSPSQRSLSSSNRSRGVVIYENASAADEIPAAPTPTPPVPWLRPLPEHGVVLCTEHRTCYTPGVNLRRHLLRGHAVKGGRAQQVEEWVAAQQIATRVTYRADGSPFIPGLQFRQGWLCAMETCRFRTASQDLIQRHCSKSHQTDIRRKQKEQRVYQTVILQCFFVKAEQYWIVQREVTNNTRLHSSHTSLPSSSGTSIRSNTTPRRLSDANIVNILAASAESAIKEDEGRYRQLGEPNHISEITPWLRKSKFHEHLAGLDSDAVATSHLTPRTDDDDARLYEVVWSIERILHKAYQLVPDLLHVDARVLNTFQVGTTSQDPFQWLQNKSSFVNYVTVFQALIYYYIRVFEGHFDQEIFIISESQRDSLRSALGVYNQLVPARKSEDSGNNSVTEADHTHTVDEASQSLTTLELELDHHMFTFCVALVQHKIKKAYDSAILSFLAARSALVSREDATITFRPEAQVAGMLSKLIYCCQLVLLQDAHHLKEHAELEDIEVPLQQLCQQWLVNNTRGPVAVMDDWRLYTMHVGGAFIPEALVVWDTDGKNLIYGDIRYGIRDLVSEIGTALLSCSMVPIEGNQENLYDRYQGILISYYRLVLIRKPSGFFDVSDY